MNRADRRHQSKDDLKRIAHGIDPESRDPEPTAAMARQMSALLERAQREKSIDAPVKFLHSKVEATLQAAKDSRVACQKGCAHCCYVWVSATAPEVLFVAKALRKRDFESAHAKVAAAHALTRDYDFIARARRPSPCPMLETEVCSIYDVRPTSCRFASSASAVTCNRVLRELSGDTIPTPLRHLKARGAYQIALVAALSHAGLPHHHYELNAALARALERNDAESAWLSGEDIFADIRRDPTDILAQQTTRLIYRHAFVQG